VRILAITKKPLIKTTPRNEGEYARVKFVKAVLDYAWKYSQKAFKVRLPIFDIYFVRRK